MARKKAQGQAMMDCHLPNGVSMEDIIIAGSDAA